MYLTFKKSMFHIPAQETLSIRVESASAGYLLPGTLAHSMAFSAYGAY
jgi:hypothetical protein